MVLAPSFNACNSNWVYIGRLPIQIGFYNSKLNDVLPSATRDFKSQTFVWREFFDELCDRTSIFLCGRC
jgi:hypothetical protein